MQANYAVLFKVYYWDDFVERQYQRLLACASKGDVFIVVDDTIRTVPPIDHPRVFRITPEDLRALPLANEAGNNLFWYNADYPVYHFHGKHPDYPFYVNFEYDAVLNGNLDELVAGSTARNVDYMAQPVRETVEEWVFTPTHLPVYSKEDIAGYLSCIAVLSNRAVRLLLERRLAMTACWQQGEMKFWPISEVFMGTELKRAGMATEPLSNHGSTAEYNWWPPHLEDDLGALQGHKFLHPVLPRENYIVSTLRNEAAILSYFKEGSDLRSKMHRFPRTVYGEPVRQEFVRRIKRKSRRHMRAWSGALAARWRSWRLSRGSQVASLGNG